MLSREPVLVVAFGAGGDSWAIGTVSRTDVCSLDLPWLLRAIAALAFGCAEVGLDPYSVGEIDGASSEGEDEDVEKDAVCISICPSPQVGTLTSEDRRCCCLAQRWIQSDCMPAQCRRCSRDH